MLVRWMVSHRRQRFFLVSHLHQYWLPNQNNQETKRARKQKKITEDSQTDSSEKHTKTKET